MIFLAAAPAACDDAGVSQAGGRAGAVDGEAELLGKLRDVMAPVAAFYKVRGIFQGRFGFGQSPALVVIDMAYGWTDPAYAGGSARLDAAVAAIGQLLPAARARRVPVVFTTSPAGRPPGPKSAAD